MHTINLPRNCWNSALWCDRKAIIISQAGTIQIKIVLPAHFTQKQKGYWRKREKKLGKSIDWVANRRLVYELSLYPSCSFIFFPDMLILIYTLLTNVNMRNKECTCWNMTASLQGTRCNYENWILYIKHILITSQGNGFISQFYFGRRCFLLKEHILFILTVHFYETMVLSSYLPHPLHRKILSWPEKRESGVKALGESKGVFVISLPPVFSPHTHLMIKTELKPVLLDCPELDN